MTSLVVDGLTVRYPGADTCVVDGVGFTVREGETVAIAGVSGSGKTQTVLAVTRLLDTAAVVTGSARFGDVDLLSAPEEDVERVRGAGIGMVFQDPAASLNPHRRIGDQLRVILEHHGHARGRQARRRVVDMLRRVQLPDPERQARAYPHELSGGMRQRVMIAAALIAEPSIVIADEPTTALDTTVQAQILELMRTLTAETGVGLVLITHDLGIIAENAERMLLLDRGRLVEAGPVERVLARPDSDAMRALLQAADAGVSLVDAGTTPVLELSDYAVSYAERRPRPFRLRRRLDAVKPMDLTLRERETVALVGESGSGKTSLARSIAGLIPPAHGRARIRSRDLAPRLRNRSIDDLRGLQMVFQDPAGSFDPARRIGDSLAEPLRTLAPALGAAERRARALKALERAGLDPGLAQRYPHQLSGGQAQRAAVVRALIADPALLICDEPVAALDGPLRQRILGQLAAAQRASGLAVLFISHDLDVVRRIAHRVAVLYLGRVVEIAARDTLFARPRHPYTRALIDATPKLTPNRAAERRVLPGEPGSLLHPPSGCVFHPRCAYATERCRRDRPLPEDVDGVRVACHHARELDLRNLEG